MDGERPGDEFIALGSDAVESAFECMANGPDL